MRFYPLTAPAAEKEKLSAEYRTGRKIGKVSLGETWFFFRSVRKVFYIPYTDIHRYFRRVMLVPAKLCCGKGDFEVENLVICSETGEELAQIQLPGARAGKVLLECLEQLAPHAAVGRPAKEEKAEG